MDENYDQDDTITCQNCGHEYDINIGDQCPECGQDNLEQYEEKLGRQ